MLVTLVTFTLCFLKWTEGQSCPIEYQRFTQKHTFCMAPNSACEIQVHGLNNGQKDVDLILNIHNSLRSKVAMGKETRGGGLPTASDMMQMVWDKELAAVAQKWAENCQFQHDCNECRAVENFQVGQNIAYLEYYCPGGQCSDTENGKNPSWKTVIEMFYNEVADYDKQDIMKYGSSRNGKVTGHFTQVVWAKTWRVGCGFVAYQKKDYMTNFFVCNYGPAGNFLGEPMYRPGPVCSNCPQNSCCGTKCSGGNVFDGLCRMNDESEAPKYSISKNALLFYCDFSSGNGDCSNEIQGHTANIKNTLQGNILSIHLKGGKQTEVIFKKPIKARSNFCLRLTFRKMPAKAGEADLSQLQIDMTPKGAFPMTMSLFSYGISYTPFGIDMPKLKQMTFSLKFSVPPGAGEHILEVKEIESFIGNCNARPS